MTAAEDLGAVYRAIDRLMDHARTRLDLDPRDEDWARNGIFALFGLDSYPDGPGHGPGQGAGRSGMTGDPAGQGDEDGPGQGAHIETLLAGFCDLAVQAGLLDAGRRGECEDAVMGLLTLRPSAIQDRFAQIEKERGGMAAMDWFYGYCVDDTYIKKAALDRNPRFTSHGLVITINMAKPEFKDMTKAAAGNRTAGGYPKCTICHENEGFAGRDKRTLRTIPVDLGGRRWFWQFSPYGYFNQHGICVNREHTPMHVDRSTFSNLLDFVDRFPGYFLGCNAALPRIGGSVLAHDHYQGGGEILPMHRAGVWQTMRAEGHPEARVEILDWPGTAVRVVSHSRREIVDLSERIRQGWATFDDPDQGIICRGEDDQQSALSPTVIASERGYEMSLIFRNNGVSPDYPDGIFHIHPEYYPIKQEPIGLIEAQGLFILPARLVGQLADIRQALIQGDPLPQKESDFTLEWGDLTARLAGGREPALVEEAIRDELGGICERMLENTAVFKRKESTRSFLEGLGFKPTD